MATLVQATIYNTARQNAAWEELTPTQAQTLLTDAEDYIRTAYHPIRADLTVEEGRMFDQLVYRLAATLQKEQLGASAAQAIKSESKEGAGFKKETEYFQGSADPYPFITAMIGAFQATPTTYGLLVGKVTG